MSSVREFMPDRRLLLIIIIAFAATFFIVTESFIPGTTFSDYSGESSSVSAAAKPNIITILSDRISYTSEVSSAFESLITVGSRTDDEIVLGVVYSGIKPEGFSADGNYLQFYTENPCKECENAWPSIMLSTEGMNIRYTDPMQFGAGESKTIRIFLVMPEDPSEGEFHIIALGKSGASGELDPFWKAVPVEEPTGTTITETPSDSLPDEPSEEPQPDTTPSVPTGGSSSGGISTPSTPSPPPEPPAETPPEENETIEDITQELADGKKGDVGILDSTCGPYCDEYCDIYFGTCEFEGYVCIAGPLSSTCWCGPCTYSSSCVGTTDAYCGSDGCVGDCDGTAGSTDACYYDNIGCTGGGGCSDSYTYLDSSSTYCNSCIAGVETRWSIGGNTAATSCCGDDANENYRNTPLSGDSEACCTTATACVADNTCYNSGSVYTGSEYICNSGSWLACTTSNKCQIVGSYCCSGDGSTWSSGTSSCDCDVCGTSSYCRTGACYDSDAASAGGDYACETCLGKKGAYMESIGFETGTNAYCCGDDGSGENYKFLDCFNAESECSDDTGDDMCCTASTDCVDGGTCYTCGTYRNIESDSQTEVCSCGGGGWVDPDRASSYCTGSYHWDVVGGDAAADYNDYCGGDSPQCCCGDDSGESYETCNNGQDVYWASDGTDGCCDSSSDCIRSDTCYTAGVRSGLNGGSRDDKAYCINSYWYDCDDYYGTCGSGICGTSSGIASGESAEHGEYSLTNIAESKKECCGDESGESYRSGGIGSPTAACCNSGSDCIEDGNCISSGSRDVSHGQAYICSSGSWVTCNTGAACDNLYGYYCSGSQWISGTATCNPCDDGTGSGHYCSQTVGECTDMDPFNLYAQYVCEECFGYDYNTGFDSGTTQYCCGDDTVESYESSWACTGTCHGDADYSLTDNDNGNQGGTYSGDGTSICCNGGNDCVDGGTCYDQISNSRTLTASVKGFCYQSQWLDCDGSDAAWCGGAGGTPCGDYDMYSGEAGVGEYDSTSVIECCGDDLNENVCSGSCTLGTTRCCSSSSDCIDSGDTCVDTASTECISIKLYTCGSGAWDSGVCSESCGAECDSSGDYDSSGGYCSYNCDSTTDCVFDSSLSCSSGSSSCFDDGYASGSTCYYNEACSSSGYTPPSTTGCANSDCTADGVYWNSNCVWDEACGGSGRTASSAGDPYGCDYGSWGDGAGYCYNDGTHACYYSGSDRCTGTGWSYSGSANNCRDPGVVVSTTCYWDNNGGGESNSCSSSGCTGISTTAAPTSCDDGSWGDGAGYCYNDAADGCYYNSGDRCTTSGWDYTSDSCDAEGTVADGGTSSAKCYYDYGCSTSGASTGCKDGQVVTAVITCDSYTNWGNGVGYCLGSAANACYYSGTDLCAADDDGWDYSTQSCYAYCLDDDGTDGSCTTTQKANPDSTASCYYSRGCGTGGCTHSSTNLRDDYCDTCGSGGRTNGNYCPPRGTVSGGYCYYDAQSDGGVRTDDCSSSSCVGISSEAEPSSCTSGSWADGAMACWTGTTCYYSSDGCAADDDGWDYSSDITECSAGTATCCTDSTTVWESVGCTSTGVTGSSYDRDTSLARCESTASGCSAYTWVSSATACCGDDSGESFQSTSDGQDSCCNGATISDDTRCSATDEWAVDGTYCTQEVYDSGSTSGTAISGDDIVCGCDSGGNICDSYSDSDGTADGICASISCISGLVAFNAGTYYDTCSSGYRCDSNVNSGGTPPQYVAEGVCASTSCCTADYVDGNNDGTQNDAVCGCGSSYNGYRCDSNADGTWDGVCAIDNGGTWGCDTDTVFYNTTYYFQLRAFDNSTDGNACENGAIGSDGFTQEGYGISDGTCDTVNITVSDCSADNNVTCNGSSQEMFYSTCGFRTGYADSCDTSITSGVSWEQTGICIYDGWDNDTACDSSAETVKYDATTYYSDCYNGGSPAWGEECDSSSATGGDYNSTGICVYDGGSASSEDSYDCSSASGASGVCDPGTGNYQSSCAVSGCDDNENCDYSGVSDLSFDITGHCQGSNCCQLAAGGSQGAACDIDGDCGTYNSGATCYYSGDCSTSCLCSYSTDTSCPVSSASCESGGCDSNYCYIDSTDTCYYGTSTCGGSGWTDKSSENCPDYCIDDNDGGACAKTTHTVSSAETCYWTDSCSVSGCSLGSSAALGQNECDTCGASGVTQGDSCPSSGTTSGNTCYYGTQSCTGTTCNLNQDTTIYSAVAWTVCDQQSQTGTDDYCYDDDTDYCYYQSGDSCDTTNGWGDSGASDFDRTECYDPATVTGGNCYYTSDGTETGICTSTGCNGNGYASSSCSSGSSSCSDDGYASGGTCYYDEACSTTSYTAPSQDPCTNSGCNADGVISGSNCIYDETCTGTGRTASSYTFATCSSGAWTDGSGADCFVSSTNTCYYASSDPCTGSGPSNSTEDIDNGYEYSSITDGSSSWRLDDGTNTCQTSSDPCTTTGTGFSGSAGNCLDPGTVSVGSCYYDNGGSVNRANDCTTSGCTGVSSEASPSACTSGSWADGSMSCWTVNTCYYSSDGCVDTGAEGADGWDYSSGSTQCSAGTETCCTNQSTIWEGVTCTSSGISQTNYDRDSSLARCESTASGCSTYTWVSSATACCGDDSGESFSSTSDGQDSCCNGATISDDTRCSATDEWAVDGTFCAQEVYDSGSMSGTAISGNDVVCGCNSGGNVCDSYGDSDGTADGVCASDSCASGLVAKSGSTYYSSCTDGYECDSNVNSGGTTPAYIANGICSGGSCCTGGYVDANNNALFDDSVCACSSGYNGYRCDFNSDKTWDGICAVNNAGLWSCDTDTVFYNTTYYFQIRATDGSTDGNACEDGSIGSDAFTQEGYGLDDGTCDTVGIVAEDCDSDASASCAGTEPFYDDCGARTTYADSCDTSITSGTTWSQVGICLDTGDSAGSCDNTDETARNGATYYSDCYNGGSPIYGYECDSSSATGGDYNPDGICVYDGGSSTSESSYDCSSASGSSGVCDPGTTQYRSDCSLCSANNNCDYTGVSDLSFDITGHCQGSNCCQLAAGGSQGAACDIDGDCGDYPSGATCYYSGDCSTSCLCSYSTDTSCPVSSASCESGGCDSNYCYIDSTDTCYYGTSTCGGSGWTDKSSENCPDYCIDDNDGGACAKTIHTVSSAETCYWTDSCSVTGCLLGSSNILRQNYCDVCGESGVTSGNYCPPSGTFSGNTCYYSGQSCTGTTCDMDTQDHPICDEGDMSDVSANCERWDVSGNTDYCSYNAGDSCIGDGLSYTDDTTIGTLTCTTCGQSGNGYQYDAINNICYNAVSCSTSGWSGSQFTVYGSGDYSGNLGIDTSILCYYGTETCTAGTATNGSSSTVYGNGYTSGNTAADQSLTCYYSDIICISGAASNSTSGTYYGNGYTPDTSSTDTSGTCYHGDITCSNENAQNGTHLTIYGNGYTAGNTGSDTSLVCYYTDWSCGDGTYSNGTSITVYGNGYEDGNNCYYGDITCSDNSAQNGTVATNKQCTESVCTDTGWDNSMCAATTTQPVITPASPSESDDLVCNATLTNTVNTTLIAYWRWYQDGSSYLMGMTYVSNGSNSIITTLTSGNTSYGEQWICEVTPGNGNNNGTAENSTAVGIGNSAPVTTSAYATDEVNVGQNITFDVTYADYESDTATLFVCNDSSCTNCGTGVQSYCYCYTSSYSASPLICNYTAQQSDPHTNNYWARVYDSISYSNIIAGNDTSFLVNHAPTMSKPILNATNNNNRTTENITCYANNIQDSDADSTTAIYNWWKNDEPIMVLNMPFDTNVSSTATWAIKDYSGYNNNGTLQNFDFDSDSGWTSSGKVGGAYNFDGSDDVINLGSADMIDNMAQFTACAWIRPYNTTYENSFGLFINKDTAGYDGWNFYTRSAGGFGFSYWTTSSVGIWRHNHTYVVSANDWHHLCFSYSGGGSEGITLYANGADIGFTAQRNDSGFVQDDATDDLHIGSVSGVYTFNGTIDDVRIYNHILSPAHIYQIWLDTKDSYSNNQTIVSQETTKGDSWKCELTPNDGLTDGTPENSSSLTIENTAPVLNSITSNDSCVKQGDYVLIDTSGASDNDNDNLVLRVGESSQSFNLCNSTAGQPERSCSFQVNWADTAGHTVYGLVEDSSVVYSTERNTNINSDNTGPGQPNGLVPSAETATNDTTPSFSWNTVSDTGCAGSVSYYHIQITTAADCLSGVVQESYELSNSYTAASLSDGTYYWRVRANDTMDNFGSWPTCTKLYVDATPPNAFTLTVDSDEPTDPSGWSTTGNVSLSWTAATDDTSGLKEYGIYRNCSTPISRGVEQCLDGYQLIDTVSNTTTVYTDEGRFSNTTYYYTIKAVDNADNVRDSNEGSIQIDTDNPGVTITSPSQDDEFDTQIVQIFADFANTYLVNCNATDDVESVPHPMNNDNLVSGTADYTFGSLSEGAHTLTVTCWDQAGNVQQDSIGITVDTQAPTVTYVLPTPGDNSRQISNSVTINVTVSDATMNVDTCTLDWDGQNETMTKVGTGNSVTCYATKATTDGNSYSFRVYANDSIGNLGAEASRSFTENTKPAISLVNVTPDSPFTTNDLTCSVSGWSDNEGDGQNYYFIWIKNSIQNTSVYTSATSVVLQSGNTTKDDTWNCTIVPYDVYENGTALSDSVLIANTAPTTPTTLTPTTGLYGGDSDIVPISCSGSTDDDIDAIYYNIDAYYDGSWYSIAYQDADGSYDWNISSLSSQSNVDIRCNATDMTETSGYLNPAGTFTIDNTPPSTSSNFTSSAWYNSDQTIQLICSDSPAGCDTILYCVDQAGSCVPDTEYTIPVTITTNAINYIRFYANDTLNNIETVNQQQVAIDKIYPDVFIYEPDNITYAYQTGIPLNYGTYDALSGINQSWYKLNGGANNYLSGNTTFNVVSDGNYYISVQTNDTAGNLNNTEILYFTVDTLPPSIIITSPVENYNYSSLSINMDTTISDINLDSCWYSLNGWLTNTTFNCASTILTVTEGSNTVRVAANDTGGNVNMTESVTFVSDVGYPQFSTYGQTPVQPHEDQSFTANVTITDIVSGVEEVLFELNGLSNYTVSQRNGNVYSFEAGIGNYSAHETVSYRWYASDFAGNTNLSSQSVFVVKNQLPTVGSFMINDTAPVTDAVVLCNNGTFTDNDDEDVLQGREYIWYVNGSVISGETSQTLDLGQPCYGDRGDNITCSQRVYDGYEWGNWVNSTGIVTVVSTPPTVPTTLTPASGTYGGDLDTISISCSGSTDTDPEDTVYYNIEAYYDGSWNSIAYQDADGSYDWNISLVASQGGVDLRCNATDLQSSSDYLNPAGTFVIDNTPPTTGSILISDTSGYTNDTTPDLSISSTGADEMRLSCDSGSWTDWLAYVVSYSSFNITDATYGCLASDGSHTIYVQFRDYLNNTQQILASDTTVYDTTPPESFSLTEMGGWSTTGNVTMLWSPANDVSSYITKYEIWRRSTSPLRAPETYSLVQILGNGTTDFTDTGLMSNTTYYYTIRAYDVIGYYRSTNEENVSVDTDNPGVNIISPDPYDMFSVSYVNVEADFANTYLVNCNVSDNVSGIQIGMNSDNLVSGTADYNLTSLSEGWHRLTVTCWDQATNTQYDTVDVVTDYSAPNGILSGVPTIWQNTTAIITLSCSDSLSGCNASGDYYYLSDLLSCPAFSASTWTEYTVPVNLVEYKYFCWSVIDNVENRNTTSSGIEILVDALPPTIGDNYTYNGQWVNTDQTVQLSPADTGGSGIDEVRYCEGSGCTPYVVLSAPYRLEYTNNIDTAVRYQVWDNAGSSSSIGSFQIMIDKSAPPVPVLISPADDKCNQAYQTFQWSSVTDNGPSGTQDYLIQVDTNSLFSSPDVNAVTAQTSYIALLDDHTEYYWRVRARDNAGNNGSFSAYRTFVTGDIECNGRTPETCPSSDYICTNSCYYLERDEEEYYCIDSTGCTPYSWLDYGTGTDSSCCGDDGSDSFQQSVNTQGMACCYNGNTLNDDTSILNVLCENGELYSCGSGSFNIRYAGDVVGIKYCNGTEWIHATGLSIGTDPRLPGIGSNITIWSDYSDIAGGDVLSATALMTIEEDSTGIIIINQAAMIYNSTSERYEYYYLVNQKGLYRYYVSLSKAGYQPQQGNDTFGAIGTLNIEIKTNSNSLDVSLGHSVSSMRPERRYYISFGEQGYVFAPVSESGMGVFPSASLLGPSVSLEQSFTNPAILFAVTKGDNKTIDRRIDMIRTGEFFTKITPSFAFGFGSEYPIKILLDNKLDMTGGTDGRIRMGTGYHKIEFEIDEDNQGSQSVGVTRSNAASSSSNDATMPSDNY
ncbi:MAG: hypothetical protein JW716_01465 [Candidatus Aenigmarchaeota archaeon]|nr:hypothetical protein [Candidatus Aenigmarchaeota archaeon]